MPRKSLEEKARLAQCKVKKKGLDSKRANMEKVRDLVDNYEYCFVFNISNFRNPLMKTLKDEWSTSRFFCGKIKPTIVALGKNISDEYRINLHYLSQSLQTEANGAHRGILFTNILPTKVIKYFNNYSITTFAKTGFVAKNDFIVKEGILNNFVFSQEYTLRRLGLAVVLRNGKLCLDADYTICKRGQPLKPEQCKLLELFNQPQAEFKLDIHSYWSNDNFYKINKQTGQITKVTDENEEETKINDINVDNNDNNNNNNLNMFDNINIIDSNESKINEMDDIDTTNNLKNDLFGTDNNGNDNNVAAFMNDDDSEEEDDDIL